MKYTTYNSFYVAVDEEYLEVLNISDVWPMAFCFVHFLGGCPVPGITWLQRKVLIQVHTARNVNVYYQTFCGLRTKTDESMPKVLGTEYDTVILTETWLHDGIPNSKYLTSSFRVLCRDCDYTSRIKYEGGVEIPCKQVLNAHWRNDMERYQ